VLCHVASCLHTQKLEAVLQFRQYDVSISWWRPGFSSAEIAVGLHDFAVQFTEVALIRRSKFGF
jgi:hypothetical protein